MECVNHLGQLVGGDPYLNVIRSNLLVASGKLGEAREACRDAIAQEPTLKKAYWSLVDISLREKKFDETVDLLNLLADKFQVRVSDLTKVPAYAEFVRSPQYQKWLESREKK